MSCPRCGSKVGTDDNVHFYCKNLFCFNAWFEFVPAQYHPCPRCGKEMTQVYHSMPDFFSDECEGAQYHWKCPDAACGWVMFDSYKGKEIEKDV